MKHHHQQTEWPNWFGISRYSTVYTTESGLGALVLAPHWEKTDIFILVLGHGNYVFMIRSPQKKQINHQYMLMVLLKHETTMVNSFSPLNIHADITWLWPDRHSRLAQWSYFSRCASEMTRALKIIAVLKHKEKSIHLYKSWLTPPLPPKFRHLKIEVFSYSPRDAYSSLSLPAAYSLMSPRKVFSW